MDSINKIKNNILNKIFNADLSFFLKEYHLQKLFFIKDIKKSGTTCTEFDGCKHYIDTKSVQSNCIVSWKDVQYNSKPSRADILVQIGDVLFAKMKNAIKVLKIDESNKENIYSTGFYCFNSKFILPEYFELLLLSPLFNKIKDENSSGTTMKAINDKNISKIYLTVPSIDEQKIVLSKVSEIFLCLNNIVGSNKKIKNIKKRVHNKIINLAIQGKLTKQCVNDEKVEKLIEGICCKKKQLIKQKIIKKDKNFISINQLIQNQPDKINSLLYKIPTNWKWVTLSDLCQQITDGTHKTPKYIEKGVPFLSVKNISSGVYDNLPKFISFDEHQKLISRCNPQKNDILFCRIGTLGKPFIVDFDFDFSIFVSLGLIKLIDKNLVEYIKLVLSSPLADKFINTFKVGGGTHTNKINICDLHKMPIPLPPLDEQKRILIKIKKIQKLLSIF